MSGHGFPKQNPPGKRDDAVQPCQQGSNGTLGPTQECYYVTMPQSDRYVTCMACLSRLAAMLNDEAIATGSAPLPTETWGCDENALPWFKLYSSSNEVEQTHAMINMYVLDT